MAINFYAYRNFSRFNNGYPEAASFKNIPIELLDAFRAAFPGKYRIRYRGPRNELHDVRTPTQRRQDCLKLYANRFSAYAL